MTRKTRHALPIPVRMGIVCWILPNRKAINVPAGKGTSIPREWEAFVKIEMNVPPTLTIAINTHTASILREASNACATTATVVMVQYAATLMSVALAHRIPAKAIGFASIVGDRMIVWSLHQHQHLSQHLRHPALQEDSDREVIPMRSNEDS